MKNVILGVLLSLFTLYINAQTWNVSLHITFEQNGEAAVIDTTILGNIWQKGVPQKAFLDSAFSIPYAIITDTLHLYPSGNLSSFQIVMKPYEYCWGIGFLEFVHKYDFDSLYAGGYIDVAYDTSSQFINIIYDTVEPELGVSSYNFYSIHDTIIGGIPAFTGKSSGWVGSQFEWIWQMGAKGYEHDSLTVRFNFLSSDDAIPKEGWLIDNIYWSLDGCTGHVIKLSSPKIRVFPNPLTSEGYLRLSSLPICSLNIEIFNRQGEIIKKYKGEGGQNFHLTRDNIPSGLYLYKITTDDQKIYTGKFIIQ